MQDEIAIERKERNAMAEEDYSMVSRECKLVCDKIDECEVQKPTLLEQDQFLVYQIQAE